jgi:hypothetical protein
MKYMGLHSVVAYRTESDVLQYSYGIVSPDQPADQEKLEHELVLESLESITDSVVDSNGSVETVLDSVPESIEQAPGPVLVPELINDQDAHDSIPVEEHAGDMILDHGSDKPPTMTFEEMAHDLESKNTKAALVAMAESLNLDTTGTKIEIARRIVEYYSLNVQSNT